MSLVFLLLRSLQMSLFKQCIGRKIELKVKAHKTLESAAPCRGCLIPVSDKDLERALMQDAHDSCDLRLNIAEISLTLFAFT